MKAGKGERYSLLQQDDWLLGMDEAAEVRMSVEIRRFRISI